MPTYYFDHKTALSSLPVLNGHITSFHRSILFSRRIYSPSLKNREQCLQFISWAFYHCLELWLTHLIINSAIEFVFGSIATNSIKLILGKEFAFNQGEWRVCRFWGIKSSQDKLLSQLVQVTWEYHWRFTLSWTASIDTISLNFPRQINASWSFASDSGLKVKDKIAIFLPHMTTGTRYK